jgi:hypothetical protein
MRTINCAMLKLSSITFLLLASMLPVFDCFADNETRTPHPELNGKIIRSINFEIKNIFDEDNLSKPYKIANSAKIQTHEFVVRRELFFKEGEQYNDFNIQESERQLREQRFLRSANIKVVPDGNFVDITVIVQDTWTIIPEVSISNGGGSKKEVFGISDSDLFGYGKRVEVLRRNVDGRSETEVLGEDPRFLGTKIDLVGAYFDRDDGQVMLGSIGQPFRTLIDKHAWSVETENSSIVGRLFENGTERFLYGKDTSDIKARYSVANGDPEKHVERFSFGAELNDVTFSQATLQDFENLNIDPAQVSHDPSLLASDRRYYGPLFGYQNITPDFISMNYIDRFDRVQDYNLGREYSIDMWLTPQFLGSRDDAAYFNANRSGGMRFGRNEFMRYEFGGSTRVQTGFNNTLLRGETKYYNVLGPLEVGPIFLGRHTFASNFFVDYGYDLDKDREFIAGGDTAIRGYDNRAFSGDKRAGLSLEDRIHLTDDVLKLFSVGGVFFFDMGGASRQSVASFIGDDIYSSVGTGLRIGFPRSSGGGVIRLEVAFPLRDGPDGTQRLSPQFNFGVGQFFDSRLRSEKLGTQNANVAIGFDR